MRRRTVAFPSLLNFVLPTPSSAQSRGATRAPCSRVTWYRAMYRSVCLFKSFVCCIRSTLFFRLNTSPRRGAVGVATFHPGYFVVSSSNPPPWRWPAGVFSHDFSLVLLAPEIPSISTRARLAIVPFLWLVCRRAFPARPRHTGGMRQVPEPFLPPPPHRRHAVGF